MTSRRQPKYTWGFVVAGFVLAAIVLGVILLVGTESPVWTVVRFGALLGYVAVFLASLSSAFLRQLVRTFGRPFVQVHHIVSVSGLVLLLTHALGVAWDARSLRVFILPFSSITRFLELGGRPAIWLIGVAALGALLRATLRKSWRAIHWMNYVAFLLGTVHGVLIGTDFELLPVRVIAIAMAVTVVGVFVWKRVEAAQRRAKRRR